MKKFKRLVDHREIFNSAVARKWQRRVKEAVMPLLDQALKEHVSLIDVERLIHEAGLSSARALMKRANGWPQPHPRRAHSRGAR